MDTVEVEGLRVAYERAGQGRRWSCSTAMWATVR